MPPITTDTNIVSGLVFGGHVSLKENTPRYGGYKGKMGQGRRPRRDSNAQPTDSKSGTLSIELRGRLKNYTLTSARYSKFCICRGRNGSYPNIWNTNTQLKLNKSYRLNY